MHGPPGTRRAWCRQVLLPFLLLLLPGREFLRLGVIGQAPFHSHLPLPVIDNNDGTMRERARGIKRDKKRDKEREREREREGERER